MPDHYILLVPWARDITHIAPVWSADKGGLRKKTTQVYVTLFLYIAGSN